MQSLKFLNLKGCHIFQQLRWEEILLRHTNHNWLVWNTGPVNPAIIVGYGGKPHELVHTDLAERDGIPLIRRYTGGGTVIVDENSVFSSIIMNAEDANLVPYPRNIMQWSEDIYGPVFKELLHSDNKFSLRENDYVIGDLKIGGNAQSITKNRFVHHTSFLWNFDRKNMEYLKMPARRPDYRKDREHSSFLGALGGHIPTDTELLNSLISELSSRFVVEHVDADAIPAILDAATGEKTIEDLARTKYM